MRIGKRVMGIRVARLNGRPVGFGWALLLAVVPPLVTDRDLRGLHDCAATPSCSGADRSPGAVGVQSAACGEVERPLCHR
jgi:uncharacterized RDD family membrane protein YckC